MSGTATRGPWNDSYVYIGLSGGHRQSYLSTLSQATGLGELSGPATPSIRAELVASKYLLFASPEDDLSFFLSVALRRAALGRPTTAVLLGIGRAFEAGSIKAVLKRGLYRNIRRTRQIKLVSVLPHYLDPRFKSVTTAWMYDPQFWDLANLIQSGQLPETTLAGQMTAAANGRPVLLFLGSPSEIKGFQFLQQILDERPLLADRLLVAVAGKVPAQFKAAETRLASYGVWFADKYLSEDEVISLKAACDTLWACYHPSYNFSSGLFGRALQLDKNVIIRRSSYLEQIAAHLNYHVEPCTYNDVDEASRILESLASGRKPDGNGKLAQVLYSASVPVLLDSVGLSAALPSGRVRS